MDGGTYGREDRRIDHDRQNWNKWQVDMDREREREREREKTTWIYKPTENPEYVALVQIASTLLHKYGLKRRKWPHL